MLFLNVVQGFNKGSFYTSKSLPRVFLPCSPMSLILSINVLHSLTRLLSPHSFSFYCNAHNML